MPTPRYLRGGGWTVRLPRRNAQRDTSVLSCHGARRDRCGTRVRASHTSKKEETMRRILLVVGIAFAALAAAPLAVTAAAPAAGPPRYLDADAPIKERVGDLLERMTLAEKVGQMDQIVIGKLRDTNSPAN